MGVEDNEFGWDRFHYVRQPRCGGWVALFIASGRSAWIGGLSAVTAEIRDSGGCWRLGPFGWCSIVMTVGGARLVAWGVVECQSAFHPTIGLCGD